MKNGEEIKKTWLLLETFYTDSVAKAFSVHVNNNYLATIISLKYVTNMSGVCVTMDILIEKAVNVVMRDGTVFKFKKCGLVLYYYDMASTDDHNSSKITPTSCYQL